MAYLRKDEVLNVKDVYVDGSSSWHFPNGNDLIKKGKRLVKKSGYVIYDYKNEREMSLEELENINRKLRGGCCCEINCFSELREFVDRKNKIYYVWIGKVVSYNLGC